MARVLVVDDDPTVREVVVSYLRAAEHEVVEAADGETALRLGTRDAPPDLVVLDLMLPGIDGLEVCRRLREDERRPGDHADRARRGDRPRGRARGRRRRLRHQAVQPARAGAARRLGAAPRRRRARRRRGGWSTATSSSTRPRTRRTASGEPLALTGREFDLLRFLLAHPGTAFSRDELLEQVWGWSFGDQSTVTVHVRRLREKVEPDPTRPVRLLTVWGVGYRWEAAT